MTESVFTANPPNWYKIDITKLKTVQDVGELIAALEIAFTTENRNFDKIKHLLNLPEPRKSLDLIQKELDEKFNSLKMRTEMAFLASKTSAEYRYDKKLDQINEDFQYAKEQGHFPVPIYFGHDGYGSLGACINTSPSTVGHWKIAPNFIYAQHKKPNWFFRKLAKAMFDLEWVDS